LSDEPKNLWAFHVTAGLHLNTSTARNDDHAAELFMGAPIGANFFNGNLHITFATLLQIIPLILRHSIDKRHFVS
jgi:hypothetical protein